jgi:hypothetical protein
MATWCLFLVQAMFITIPQSIRGKSSAASAEATPVSGNESFEYARRQADEALRSLAN